MQLPTTVRLRPCLLGMIGCMQTQFLTSIAPPSAKALMFLFKPQDVATPADFRI
jgi:hypothetical protein